MPGGGYVHNLAAARRGNLLFLVAGVAGVIAWGTRRFSPATGLVAGLLYSVLPPVLAHAGLATTDMAIAGVFPFFLLALETWFQSPSYRHATALGIVTGVGALTKFTFLPFSAVALLIYLATHRDSMRRMNRSVFAVIAIAFLLVWGAYKFEVKTFVVADKTDYIPTTIAPGFLKPVAAWTAAHVPLPAPEYAIGLGWLILHDRDGHPSFLLGWFSEKGFWFYFPVVFFYKTPIVFLLLSAIGGGLLLHRRRDLDVVILPLALLAVVMPSSINIGIRHILPIYTPLSLLTAHGVVVLWQEGTHWFSRSVVAALVALAFLVSVRAHPDYLSWFNIAAGEHPETIAVDSNLDWGQDMLRLKRVVERRHIEHFSILYNGTTDLARLAFPASGLLPYTPTTGWVVVSESALALHPDTLRGGFDWLRRYAPVEKVGTLRLYNISCF